MGSLWRRCFGSRNVATNRVQAVAAMPSSQASPAASPPSCTLPPAELENRFHRFVLSLPATAPGTTGAFEPAALKRLELLSTRFDVHSLPRLPTVLPQLLRSLKNDNTAGAQLAALIGRDPLMVGEVMRVTGSVYYRSAQPISSLQQAVVLLGQDGLRRVLTQHAMKPILRANAGALGEVAGERLWEHAERCAHACAWLGRHDGCDAFEAYLAGIVCHAGTGAVVRLLGQLALPDPPSLSPGFLAGTAQLAARLSLQAARHWSLPPRVIEALAERLDPDNARAISPLGKALSSADRLAMIQLLQEHGQPPGLIDFDNHWPGGHQAARLTRCLQDLGQHFPHTGRHPT